MFDDEDGVAHVAEPFETAQKAVVIARMQANAGLVQYVKDADQAAADLAGQPNALGLTARQSWGVR